jgi:hypothetical protein
MKADDFNKMSNDELWSLHLEVSAELTKRLAARIDELDECLRKLPTSAPNRRALRRPNAGERQYAARAS